jgi:uncharacterized peroxidase-related enzyme
MPGAGFFCGDVITLRIDPHKRTFAAVCRTFCTACASRLSINANANTDALDADPLPLSIIRRTIMTRIALPADEQIPAASRPVVDAITKQLKMTPNLFRIMALSPNALNGWAGLQGALAKTLDTKLRDGIALAVSQVNGCQYCLSAHSHVASTLANIDDDEIRLNRAGQSGAPKTAAAVTFAKKLMETHGKVSEDDLQAVRAAGFTDANIVEIIALSAQFLLTNFVNNAFDTEIDFPVVETEIG